MLYRLKKITYFYAEADIRISTKKIFEIHFEHILEGDERDNPYSVRSVCFDLCTLKSIPYHKYAACHPMHHFIQILDCKEFFYAL